jgi:hypothetical protein
MFFENAASKKNETTLSRPVFSSADMDAGVN